MEAREYLEQMRYLDNRIKCDIQELEALRQLSLTVSSFSFEEHNSTMPNTEAPFIRSLHLIDEMEFQVQKEVRQCTELRKEVMDVIRGVKDVTLNLVLRYRYLLMMSWREIGKELGTDSRTVRRWHEEAIASVVLPESPMVVE